MIVTRTDLENLIQAYRAELLGHTLEIAAGDERKSALVFAVLVAERIAVLSDAIRATTKTQQGEPDMKKKIDTALEAETTNATSDIAALETDAREKRELAQKLRGEAESQRPPLKTIPMPILVRVLESEEAADEAQEALDRAREAQIDPLLAADIAAGNVHAIAIEPVALYTRLADALAKRRKLEEEVALSEEEIRRVIDDARVAWSALAAERSTAGLPAPRALPRPQQLRPNMGDAGVAHLEEAWRRRAVGEPANFAVSAVGTIVEPRETRNAYSRRDARRAEILELRATLERERRDAEAEAREVAEREAERQRTAARNLEGFRKQREAEESERAAARAEQAALAAAYRPGGAA
jgi:hypothetical protein